MLHNTDVTIVFEKGTSPGGRLLIGKCPLTYLAGQSRSARFSLFTKKHKLQNPKNKREILADDKLRPIFGAKKMNMFQMTKAVNKHLK